MPGSNTISGRNVIKLDSMSIQSTFYRLEWFLEYEVVFWKETPGTRGWFPLSSVDGKTGKPWNPVLLCQVFMVITIPFHVSTNYGILSMYIILRICYNCMLLPQYRFQIQSKCLSEWMPPKCISIERSKVPVALGCWSAPTTISLGSHGIRYPFEWLVRRGGWKLSANIADLKLHIHWFENRVRTEFIFSVLEMKRPLRAMFPSLWPTWRPVRRVLLGAWGVEGYCSWHITYTSTVVSVIYFPCSLGR